jgi:hypothetical protein
MNLPLRGLVLFAAGFAAALAAGWVAFPAMLYERTSQPLEFNHKIHKVKGEMACQDCHAMREDGSFAGIPALDNCATCHAEPLGKTVAEKTLVDKHVTPNQPIEWLVYSRQPVNVRFSHATHVNVAKLKCENCHGEHGATERLRPYEENRISGYSRDIWGRSIARASLKPGDAMKMSDCEGCHDQHNVEAGCLGCHK